MSLILESSVKFTLPRQSVNVFEMELGVIFSSFNSILATCSATDDRPIHMLHGVELQQKYASNIQQHFADKYKANQDYVRRIVHMLVCMDLTKVDIDACMNIDSSVIWKAIRDDLWNKAWKFMSIDQINEYYPENAVDPIVKASREELVSVHLAALKPKDVLGKRIHERLLLPNHLVHLSLARKNASLRESIFRSVHDLQSTTTILLRNKHTWELARKIQRKIIDEKSSLLTIHTLAINTDKQRSAANSIRYNPSSRRGPSVGCSNSEDDDQRQSHSKSLKRKRQGEQQSSPTLLSDTVVVENMVTAASQLPHAPSYATPPTHTEEQIDCDVINTRVTLNFEKSDDTTNSEGDTIIGVQQQPETSGSTGPAAGDGGEQPEQPCGNVINNANIPATANTTVTADCGMTLRTRSATTVATVSPFAWSHSTPRARYKVDQCILRVSSFAYDPILL